MCRICIIEKHKEIVIGDGGLTVLFAGRDENDQIFLYASGETVSDWYYPNYCPECGKKLKEN